MNDVQKLLKRRANDKARLARKVTVRRTFDVTITKRDGTVKTFTKLGSKKAKDTVAFYRLNGAKVSSIETTPLVPTSVKLGNFIEAKVRNTVKPEPPKVDVKAQNTKGWISGELSYEPVANDDVAPAFLSDYVRPKFADVKQRIKAQEIRNRNLNRRAVVIENKFKIRDRVTEKLLYSGNDEFEFVVFMVNQKIDLDTVIVKVPEYIKRKVLKSNPDVRFE